MPKRIVLRADLSVEELEQRYRKAKDRVERSQWHIIWLYAQGNSTKEIMAATGYSANWIREILHRYNRDGPNRLGDQRHYNAGPDRYLSAEQQAELREALRGPAPNGGSWTGKKVSEWIKIHAGLRMHPQSGWAYMRRLSNKRKPRRKHTPPNSRNRARVRKQHS